MNDPHSGRTLSHAAAPLTGATGAVVLLHGRGATAPSILGLAPEIDAAGWAFLAPQARGGAWYPNSFLAPLDANEPWLSSAIRAVLAAIERAEAAGIARERIVLGGFSQGACLALETAARHPGRWGAAFALSGGLIGTGQGPADAPPMAGMGGHYPDKAFDYDGDLAGAQVFIGGSDIDPHVPLARMERTADVFRQRGAAVDLRVYPGTGHTVVADELAAVRALLASVAGEG